MGVKPGRMLSKEKGRHFFALKMDTDLNQTSQEFENF